MWTVVCANLLWAVQNAEQTQQTGENWERKGILTEGGGIPIAITLTGANVHDKKEVGHLLAVRPDFLVHMGADDFEQHFCADKGYDYADIRTLISLNHYIQ